MPLRTDTGSVAQDKAKESYSGFFVDQRNILHLGGLSTFTKDVELLYSLSKLLFILFIPIRNMQCHRVTEQAIDFFEREPFSLGVREQTVS